MKRSFVLYACLTFVAALSLMGCPSDEPRLNVSVNNLHFGVNEATESYSYETEKQIEVQNTGGSETNLVFEISTDQPWIEVTPANGSIAGGDAVTVTVTIDRDYAEEIKSLDFAEGAITVDASNMRRTIGVTTAPNYFTQIFSTDNAEDMFDLEGKQLWLTPNGGPSYYAIQTEDNPGGFPTDPAGGLWLNFDELGDPVKAAPFGSELVPFYGQHFDTLYIASGGWVSFGEPGNNPDSLDEHFAIPQLSALPVDALDQGVVSYMQDADKLIITYEDVPSANDPNVTNDFQIDLYFDGTIRITYLNVDPLMEGVVGLSAGVGEEPIDFLESTLNTNPIGAKLN